MGTWDTGAFDNDAAADLLASLADAPQGEPRTAILCRALDAVVANEGYLDYDDAAAGAAAAVLVAHARGGLDPGVLQALVDGGLDVPEDLVPLAVAALDRVVAGDSEWRDLWSDGTAFDEARSELTRARAALS